MENGKVSQRVNGRPSSPEENQKSSAKPSPDNLKLSQHVLAIIKHTRSSEARPGNTDEAEAPKSNQKQTPEPPKQRARASRLEVKTVNEIWDVPTHQYKIVDSIHTSDVNELDEYIFVVRQRIERVTEVATYFVDIKSELLRDSLRVILESVSGISLGEDKPTIERNTLYHFLPELEAAKAEVEKDRPLFMHLEFLIEHIKSCYSSTTERLAPLLKNHEITYDLLWALFKPNMPVYTTCFGTQKPRCVKFDFGEERKTEQSIMYFRIEARYLDYDGKVFGEARVATGIEQFRGSKPITSLRSYPLHYHQDESKIRKELADSGRKFLGLKGINHCQFEGAAFYMRKEQVVQVIVNSRITVDAAFFRQTNPNYIRPSIDYSVGKRRHPNPLFDSLGYHVPTAPFGQDRVHSNGLEPDELDEDDLMLCSPTVLGFSYSDKLWLEFAVADTKDIEWNTSSFDHLVMPEEQKDMVLALAETHMGTVPSVPFDDVVEGKGQGLTVLLHGRPGVGKTLTAEVLSEYLRRPLYSISAGELGIDAAKLEDQLTHVFQLGSRWDALLLLDEADVFLEQRSTENLVRHGLVSVFLRRLEYFRGILLLTTNRVENFDEAILSRIHMQLKYGELNADARKKVWRIFLEKAKTPSGAMEISDKEMEQLIKKKLNGRQIKNTVATARALATKRETRVNYATLQIIIAAGEMFDRDFRGTHNQDRLYT